MRAATIVMAAVLAFAARAEDAIAVRIHEQVSIAIFGATAAFSVDSAVADASVQNGVLTIFGRGAGRTKVTVLTVTGPTEYEVRVEVDDAAAPRQLRAEGNGRVETRIETAVPQIHTAIDISQHQASSRTDIHVETVTYRESQGNRSSTTLPSAAISFLTPNRELTFLDRSVDQSPLTLKGATVRGLHYRDDRWTALAGYTAYASYQSFLLPADRSFVAGAAYRVALTDRVRLTPSLFSFDNGVAGSVLGEYERGERGRHGMFASVELGVGRTVAAAANLVVDDDADHIRVDLRYRPSRYPGITFGQPRGFNADASWSRTFGRSSTSDTSIAVTDFAGLGLNERVLTATNNVRFRLTDTWSLIGGGSYGRFANTRSLTIPAGLQLDRPRFGMSAQYRWSQSSATNRGAGGFRLAARSTTGHVFTTGYVDYQKQAPTLGLIFSEEPDLALALEQLGITATTPADIARALRENSALVALGYIDGVTIELTPVRTQAGFEMAWLGGGRARMQLRGRLLFNRNERVSSRMDTLIATISASRRLTASTDVFASYSYWVTKTAGGSSVAQPGLQLGIRHDFDGIPSLLPGGHGAITGTVFLDEDIDGVPDGRVADAEVELDGNVTVRTDRQGAFTFRGVGRGSHRVVARIPNKQAFFTTPSRVEATAGETIRFGVAITPARIFGHVVSDSGDGVANAGVVLTRGSSRLHATTSSDGSFAFAAAPGEWTLALDPALLPAGFTRIGDNTQVALDRAKPANATLVVRANRSVSGHVAAGTTTIVVEPLGRRVPVEPDGSFSIRGLPAGDITIHSNGRSERVTLPSEPASIVLGESPK